MHLHAQTISGIVLDAKTNEPIESASVFFDNTTIGTSTNDKGVFEISAKPGITSPLIISFLGFEKILITEYSVDKYYKILLVEDENPLDEVLLTYFDGMQKEKKLRYFRDQFLGLTKNGKSCTILNEDDLLLRFNKKTKQLTAHSKRPIIINNENLNYQIRFEIKDFSIDYGYVNVEKQVFRIKSINYEGTSFYKNIREKDSLAEDFRNRSYKGSILHFMRALRNENLKQEGYQLFSKSFVVEPSKYINVRTIKASDSVLVKLRLQLSVLYNEEVQSEMVSTTPFPVTKNTPQFKKPQDGDTIRTNSLKFVSKQPSNLPYFNTEIIIDKFGNYSPLSAFYFMGYMGNLRLGDTLPLDFKLKD